MGIPGAASVRVAVPEPVSGLVSIVREPVPAGFSGTLVVDKHYYVQLQK